MQKNIYSSEMLLRKVASFIVILLSNDYLYKEYFLYNIECLIIQTNNARGQVERIKLDKFCTVL